MGRNISDAISSTDSLPVGSIIELPIFATTMGDYVLSGATVDKPSLLDDGNAFSELSKGEPFRHIESPALFNSMISFKGKLFCVEISHTTFASVWMSENGTTWESKYTTLFESSSETIQKLEVVNNRLFAFSSNFLTEILEDGTCVILYRGACSDLTYDGNYYIIAQRTTTLKKTVDFSTFINSSVTPTAFYVCKFLGGKYIAIGTTAAYTSTDLVTWTSSGSIESPQTTGATVVNGYMVVPCSDTSGFYFTNSGVFTKKAIGDNFSSLCFGNGLYVYTTTRGALAVSSTIDGTYTTKTPASIYTSGGTYSACYIADNLMYSINSNAYGRMSLFSSDLATYSNIVPIHVQPMSMNIYNKVGTVRGYGTDSSKYNASIFRITDDSKFEILPTNINGYLMRALNMDTANVFTMEKFLLTSDKLYYAVATELYSIPVVSGVIQVIGSTLQSSSAVAPFYIIEDDVFYWSGTASPFTLKSYKKGVILSTNSKDVIISDNGRFIYNFISSSNATLYLDGSSVGYFADIALYDKSGNVVTKNTGIAIYKVGNLYYTANASSTIFCGTHFSNLKEIGSTGTISGLLEKTDSHGFYDGRLLLTNFIVQFSNGVTWINMSSNNHLIGGGGIVGTPSDLESCYKIKNWNNYKVHVPYVQSSKKELNAYIKYQ